MLARLIIIGGVVLRLRGLGSCCSEAGSTCVVPPPNRRLSEPFERSGTLVSIRVSSIVPVIKKNGKMRVCIDFRDLNKATPKDEYHMSNADLLIDAAAGHKILNFMDGNAGYNQIFMAEEDIPKMTFRCPGALGLYEWVVMTFGLKNAGATY